MVRVPRAVAVLAALSASGARLVEGIASECHAASGCDDDSSSLLQVNGARRTSLAVVTEKVEMKSGDGPCPSVGVEAVLTNKSLSYFMNELFPFAYVDLNQGLLEVPIQGAASGFDYSFKNLVINSVAMQSAAFKFVPQEGLDFHIANVAISFTLEYQIKTNAWRTFLFGTKKGKLAVSVSPTSFVSALIGFEYDSATTHAIVTLKDIDTEFFISNMNFQENGLFGTFLTLVVSISKPLVQTFAKEAIKSQMATIRIDVTDMFDAAFVDMLAQSPFPFPLENTTGPYSHAVDLRVCGIDTGADRIGIKAYIGVNATGTDPYNGVKGYDLSTTGAKVNYEQMVGLTMTEWTMDGLAWLGLRVAGTLGSKLSPKTVAMPADLSDPLKITSDPDARVKAVTKQFVTSAVAQVKEGALQDYGVKITEPKIRFFDRAAGFVANFELDLREMFDAHFASTAEHVKLAGEAQEEMQAIKDFAAR